MSRDDEAWQWAVEWSAALIEADLAAGYVPSQDEPDRKLKQKAMREIVQRIRRMRMRTGKGAKGR